MLESDDGELLPLSQYCSATVDADIALLLRIHCHESSIINFTVSSVRHNICDENVANGTEYSHFQGW